MGPPRTHAAWAAVALLAAAAPGCRKADPGPADAGAVHAASPANGRRSGVKVPVPEGWTARPSGEDVLAVGPIGRDVLRIELRAGQGPALPSGDALVAGFRAAAPALAVDTVDVKSEADVSLAVLRVKAGADAGSAESGLALLGAKRVEGDLFLCSTVPGATEDEVKAAAAACGTLSYSPAARR